MKKKILILFLIIFFLATTLNTNTSDTPTNGITGLFLAFGSALIEIARIVVKQILTFVAGLL